MSSYLNRYWLAVMGFLLLCLMAGAVILAIKLSNQHPAEISLNSIKPPDYRLEVYIDGAVTNPGFYPAREDDSVASLIQSAGPMPDADRGKLKIFVSKATDTGSTQKSQKISLNRAEVWLLEALPGIGQGKAQAIVDFRNRNGRFLKIDDIVKVSGISKPMLDNIKNLITVED